MLNHWQDKESWNNAWNVEGWTACNNHRESPFPHLLPFTYYLRISQDTAETWCYRWCYPQGLQGRIQFGDEFRFYLIVEWILMLLGWQLLLAGLVLSAGCYWQLLGDVDSSTLLILAGWWSSFCLMSWCCFFLQFLSGPHYSLMPLYHLRLLSLPSGWSNIGDVPKTAWYKN